MLVLFMIKVAKRFLRYLITDIMRAINKHYLTKEEMIKRVLTRTKSELANLNAKVLIHKENNLKPRLFL